MPETFLTIQEAAEVSGKSIQTIRRALKTNKLEHKRKRTPQGFNYMISRESLIDAFKLSDSLFDREPAGIKGKSAPKEVATEYAKLADLKQLQVDMTALFDEHRKEKDNFMRFMKAFQEKFVVLENQMKLLEEPQRKRKWYQFWE